MARVTVRVALLHSRGYALFSALNTKNSAKTKCTSSCSYLFFLHTPQALLIYYWDRGDIQFILWGNQYDFPKLYIFLNFTAPCLGWWLAVWAWGLPTGIVPWNSSIAHFYCCNWRFPSRFYPFMRDDRPKLFCMSKQAAAAQMVSLHKRGQVIVCKSSWMGIMLKHIFPLCVSTIQFTRSPHRIIIKMTLCNASWFVLFRTCTFEWIIHPVSVFTKMEQEILFTTYRGKSILLGRLCTRLMSFVGQVYSNRLLDLRSRDPNKGPICNDEN